MGKKIGGGGRSGTSESEQKYLQVSNGKLNGRDNLKCPGVNGRIRLKCVIGWVGVDWILVGQVKK
jgi:hypothetical protein